MNDSKRNQLETECIGIGAKVRFDTIHQAGTYVCHWSGHLIRLPEHAFSSTRSPFFNIVSRDPLFLTKISSDPFILLSQARVLASNMDVNVNF